MRTSPLRWSLRRAASTAATSLVMSALTAGLPACSVDTLAKESRPHVINSCNAHSDCGDDAVCTNGACYSRGGNIGNIDEVLLEIVPEASSPLGGTAFLSIQNGLRRGDRTRSIALAGPIAFGAQVVVNGEDLPNGCPYLRTGKQTIAARIQYVRTGSVGGVSVGGLSSSVAKTVDTEQNTSTSTSGFSQNTSLVPGVYDIYAQPVASQNCQIPSKLWRGVDVGRDGLVVGWAPPATLELPTPRTLNGRVEIRGGSLTDWQVDIIDPQDGHVISTSAKLGATTDASPFTNFEIAFQPTAFAVAALESSPSKPGNPEPLIRLRPPKEAESTAPTIYFDLEGAVSGQANLVVSNVPTAAQLVSVSGQVRGTTNVPLRATVKFLNSTFQNLPASFGRAVTTDDAGQYATKLLPGEYRVVVIPEGASDNGSGTGASPTREWALTVRREIIGWDPHQVVDLAVLPIRIIEGTASAGRKGVVAQGATLEAAPLLPSVSAILRTVISPSAITPASASVPVNDNDGKFKLIIDPGDYDFSLKPAAESNFAWWILPKQTVFATGMPDQIGTVNPQLLYPVPLEGTITVAAQPLRNATVHAYARTPRDNVVKVGIARTDDAGHYYLALPPGFGSL